MIPKLKSLFQNQNFLINGWLSIPNTFTAEAMSKMGWDTITVDMQHGQNDYSSSIGMIQAISNNSIPMARIPWNEPAIIMKLLDLGFMGIIAPMINNKKQCEEFISYCYYPPKGQRSFGPMRAQLVYGSDYSQKANDEVVSMAMIETKEAVENIDDILSVPDLTGIYIGPADLSSSYGLPPKFDNKEDIIFDKIKMIVKKTRERGKIAGIHNGTTKYAKEMLNLGYQFVTVSSDFRSMNAHAQSIVDDMKNIDNKKNIVSAY